MTVLGYWELSEEDRPPEKYYGDDDALEDWFKAVRAKHAGGRDDEDEVVPQTGNEYLKELLDGRR